MSINNDECLSLDEYIKKKQIDESLTLMDYRKKEKNIDRDELDAELDMIAEKNELKRTNRKSGLSKFERYNNDTDNSESEDDISEDVQMMDLSENKSINYENSSIKFAKEIEQLDHPDCCKIKKKFTTIESANGIKVKSQQWRVQRGDGGNSNQQSGIGRIRNGRVTKKQQTKAGIFIEKGNFTFKFAETEGNNSDDNEESIVGIVRNKPRTKVINRNRGNNGNMNQNPPVSINMNLGGLFQGVAECVKSLNIIAKDEFNALLAKRANGENPQVGTSPFQMPVDDYIINAKAGDGIDMNVTPKTTNLPLNLRFA